MDAPDEIAPASDVPVTGRVAPGPAGHPLHDHLRPFETDPLGFLSSVHATYGDVVRLRLWPEVCHLVSDPDEVVRILVTDADRFHYDPAADSPGGAPGPAPRFHQLARTVLHDDAPGRVPAITAALGTWLDDLDGAARRGPVDVADELVVAMLAVLGRSLLDEDVRSVETWGDVRDVTRAFVRMAPVGAPHRAVSSYQAIERQRAPEDPMNTAAIATIGTTVRSLIAARRARGSGGTDLLSRLVFDEHTDAPDRIERTSDLESAVAVLLVAGHSAPASAVLWAMHLLGQHDEVRDRLEHEVDTVLGGRVPVHADLPQLRFTRAVVKEAMRLYPPVWLLLPRRTAATEVVAGCTIPAGTKILISPWVLHRHPDVWSNPERFDPDRFASDEPRAYLPFGAGPWGCVGAQLGLTQTRLALAMLVQRFRWSPAERHPVVPDPQLALWPRDGLWLSLTRRS